jgi:hypothetical protein
MGRGEGRLGEDGNNESIRIVSRNCSSRVDLTVLENTNLTGLSLLRGSAFHILGKVKKGRLTRIVILCAAFLS